MGLTSSHYVTRTELNDHINQQVVFKDQVVQEIRRELETMLTDQLATKDKQIADLRQELVTTQLSLMNLEQKFPNLGGSHTSTDEDNRSDQTTASGQAPGNSDIIEREREREREISDPAIEAVVQEILADPELNLAFVPDSIEAKIYRALIRRVLTSIAKMTHQVRLDLLGHRIRLVLEPGSTN